MGADPQPLSGKTIIVTRSVSDNASLIETLGMLGATAVAVPLVEVVPPADGGEALSAAAQNLDRYRWVVLTSVNGVEALRDALGGRPWPAGVTVVPVGPATATAARTAGMVVADPPPDATASSLVATFPDMSGRPADERNSAVVLAPLAELAGPTVANGLAMKGYQVDRIEAYRTVEPKTDQATAAQLATAIRDADAATFFSPSAVDRYVDRFGVRPLPARVVCIGPATADRAVTRGIVSVVTAAPHTEAGVVQAIIRSIGEISATGR